MEEDAQLAALQAWMLPLAGALQLWQWTRRLVVKHRRGEALIEVTLLLLPRLLYVLSAAASTACFVCCACSAAACAACCVWWRDWCCDKALLGERPDDYSDCADDGAMDCLAMDCPHTQAHIATAAHDSARCLCRLPVSSSRTHTNGRSAATLTEFL